MDKNKMNISGKKEDRKGEIKIRQSTRRRRIEVFIKGTAVVLVSAVCGAVSSYYFIQNMYQSKNSKGETVLKIVDSSNDVVKQSSISKVSNSIVSISDDEKGFKNRKEINTTGVIIREDGYIITSYNDLSKMSNYVVKVPSQGINNVFKAKMVGYDEITDIAVIKINKNNLQAAELGNANTMKQGDKTITIGNCIGDDYVGFVTTGIVNSLNNTIEVPGEKDSDKISYRVIETSALINKENSGGVLIDSDGQIVGINSSYISSKYSKAPLSYVISVNEVKSIISSIINYGRVKRTLLGFDGADLVQSGSSSVSGVFIKSVTANATAAKAGLRPTDIITEFDNQKISCLDDITKLMKNHKTGDKINCKILRDGKKKEIQLSIEEAK